MFRKFYAFPIGRFSSLFWDDLEFEWLSPLSLFVFSTREFIYLNPFYAVFIKYYALGKKYGNVGLVPSDPAEYQKSFVKLIIGLKSGRLSLSKYLKLDHIIVLNSRFYTIIRSLNCNVLHYL